MPFKVNYLAQRFDSLYHPNIDILKNTLKFSGTEQREMTRIYFTEGIPYIFLKNPILYEKIRTYLADHLDTNAKYISMTGSGRLGYSLSPIGNKFGKEFTNHISDIDFFIVDEVLFSLLAKDLSIYRSLKDEIPKGKYFYDNLQLLTSNYNKGYLSQDKFPDNKIFPTASKMYSELRKLLSIMGDTPNCPQPKNASIRVYKNWDGCIDNITLNIIDALSKN